MEEETKWEDLTVEQKKELKEQFVNLIKIIPVSTFSDLLCENLSENEQYALYDNIKSY